MKFKGRNKVSPEFSMSSMTDIVFLLLVFFMLTSNAPNALDMILPKAKGKSTNTKNVAVSIKKGHQYYVNDKKVPEANVEAELKALLAGQDKPTVLLRAEEGVPVEDAVSVMDIANRNKFKVILAVRPK
ncbi:MAG: biopolymer transporter ExbD [Bacteroidetes bacterium MedPE-SWsnd-G1]|uniref:Biopolymer transporter ExbD n=1 Tax=Urechidicola vernalis TaxID=3075600 RepID=A0ABU2Y5V5_9FLAO|nr:biopolymer transporter ExbD [Urechidicola sp. P050]MDT0552640.1 biopolymer transporter ExbD [Urechidicola sp. P050]OIQ36633.1 MAG: biopolymer transporter ExbD [Bacteroidetes bacterium MedPE-SWsnd-G1]